MRGSLQAALWLLVSWCNVAAAHELFNGWRRQLQATHRAVSGDHVVLEHAEFDRSGSVEIRLTRRATPLMSLGSGGGKSERPRTWLFVRLKGVGSVRVAGNAMNALDGVFAANAPRAPLRSIMTLVDMTGADSCSPRCARKCARFLNDHGGSFDRVAVVGRGLTLHYVRFVVRLVGQRQIRVFGDYEDARRWLNLDGDDFPSWLSEVPIKGPGAPRWRRKLW
ncbi:hypothetical protein M885DRAFT_613155 [Pelagophyceae sp. CCMP2097]|nr:hypothetical protein M885DRAFT_613155 [Pelagophyceae sp. CCMP2097]